MVRRLVALLAWLAAAAAGTWGYVSALDRGTWVALFCAAFWFVALLGGGTLLRRVWPGSNHGGSRATRHAMATGTADDLTNENLPDHRPTLHGAHDDLLMSPEQKRWLKRDGW